ncbi:2-C-methyl-D-erythritol 4-phosphate cytidylyltransferase [bacterium]|nr:2-C-methyl-D-erythritol 4-phosphate cytidylyltransferase [bacterium]
MKVVAIVPSAGKSERMGEKKEFLSLGDKPILTHTLKPLEDHHQISEIILVVDEKSIERCKREIVEKYVFKKVKEVVVGGKERQDSVYNGLKRVAKDCDIVLIQDGARPFLTEDLITRSIEEAEKHKVAVVAVSCIDTIKFARKENNMALETLDREYLWMAQTPQTFRYEIILKAYEKAEEENFQGTDDASLVERMNQPVKIIRGSYDNIKITTPQDLILAEAILKKRNAERVNM